MRESERQTEKLTHRGSQREREGDETDRLRQRQTHRHRQTEKLTHRERESERERENIILYARVVIRLCVKIQGEEWFS